jgi:hypothetical protein
MRKVRISLVCLLSLFMIAFISCKKDDNNNDDTTKPLLVEDGMYVFGGGTALSTYDITGLMKATTNEAATNAERAGLVELYIAVKAGTDGFNITGVVGGVATTFGPGDDFAEVALANKIADEPRGWLSRGTLAATSNKFTVPEDGLYHIVYDATLNIVAVARVEWGIIGGATVGGWGGSTPLTASAFDLSTMTFTGTDVILTAGDFKFRYSDGWKIVLDGTNVRVNTNFGGAVTALVAGGANITNTVVGKYTVQVSWTLTGGTTATLNKTGDYTPPAYPAAMYLVGDATAYGWDSPGTHADAIMHKCAGGSPSEGIFWKICYLETGKGFKISAAGWADPNLGFSGPTEYDANGVTISDNGGNMSVAASGMYMIVLNLRDDLKKVSVIAPAVYGIGDAWGGYTEKANIFTVDNTAKTLVSPAATAAGNLRSYVFHAWIPAWWNAEFVDNANAIEYRNDGNNDPTAIPLTIGQVVTYHFDDNTATIAK